MNDRCSVSNNFLDQVQRMKRLEMRLWRSGHGRGGLTPRCEQGRGEKSSPAECLCPLQEQSSLTSQSAFTVRWDQPGPEVRVPRASKVSLASGLLQCRLGDERSVSGEDQTNTTDNC